MKEWQKYEQRQLEKHKESAPKYCPRCGRKLWKKEVSGYVGDEHFNSCKSRIYYQVTCRRCKNVTNLDGDSL